jgi:7-cyano-7-deazaguanine reductase
VVRTCTCVTVSYSTLDESTVSDKPNIETFDNPHPSRDYLVEHQAREFTSLCPKTGQPDFATISVRYIPGPLCVELKALKLYLQSFRSQGVFYEDVTNIILSDLVAACRPKWIEIESRWTVRGGIQSVITAHHGEKPK